MEFDANNIPYLRLPSPHAFITLTTYRPTDASVLISMLNHPAVYMNLAGPPFPYLQEHHDYRVERMEVETKKALKEFREFEKQEGVRKWASAVPFCVIREVNSESGEETVIGDLVFRRSNFLDINDEKERENIKSRNDALEPGEKDIIWTIGFYLVPTVHGRGIMTTVLDTLTKEWLVPYMNVYHMSGAYLEHNIASRRVFEKCGWTFVKFEPDRIELPEVMTGVKGKKFGMGVMRWNRE